MLRQDAILTTVVNWDLVCQPLNVFRRYGLSRRHKWSRNKIATKSKKRQKMITNIFQWKFFRWKGIYLKLMFFVCLYVSTATKEGANRLDCAWLKLLKGMTRSRWNGHSSLSFKSELLETRSFFPCKQKKKETRNV